MRDDGGGGWRPFPPNGKVVFVLHILAFGLEGSVLFKLRQSLPILGFCLGGARIPREFIHLGAPSVGR